MSSMKAYRIYNSCFPVIYISGPTPTHMEADSLLASPFGLLMLQRTSEWIFVVGYNRVDVAAVPPAQGAKI